MSLSLSKLDDLIDALLSNADELIAESALLGKHGHFARAHALAHIAREELAKSIMLQAAAFKVLAGARVDWAKLMKRFRSHDEKLKLEGVQSAAFLSAAGNVEQSLLVHAHATEMAKYRNHRKNAALYVELTDGKVSKPSEQFTERQSVRTFELAKMWLEEQKKMRQMLGRYDEQDPKRFKGMPIPDPEKIMESDPKELLEALGSALVEIWKHQEKRVPEES
jgi:AbiV family abortive infection protein